MSHDKHAAPGVAPARVLYVTGTGRSGSTLVSNLVGSLPGAVSVGELRFLWERGLREKSSCGCGVPVPECPFWTAVLDRSHPDGAPDHDAVDWAEDRLLRLRCAHRLVRAHARPDRLGPTAQRYARELARVYAAVAAQSGGAVVVDSSKLVPYGALLAQVDGVEVTYLHLVRDARAVSHSWDRVRERTDRGEPGTSMEREGAARSSVLWDVWNAGAEALWGRGGTAYERVRYEDVVADPRAALTPVLRRLGLDPAGLPVDGAGTVRLVVSHTVAGNPARMASGAVQLREDDAWRTAMPPASRLLVTALTAPLLGHYGYRVRPDEAAETPTPFVEDMHGLRRTRARVARNVVWVREQGLSRVLEEKDLDPLRTVPVAVARWRYRRASPVVPGYARPVLLVGLQRSGTNMIVRGLGAAPEVEVHNENDRRAFERYKLRPDPVVRDIVTASRHSHVLFKPLCDSHRTDELLDHLGTPSAPRAVWAYRDVDGRVRSALAKFGDQNLRVLAEFADGTDTTRWHVQRISADTAELVRSFDYATLSPASGAALMWVVRNRLFLELGLDRRRDVRLVSYDAFLAAPEATMRDLCEFLEFGYSPNLVRHVAARPPTFREPLEIDPRVRAACNRLTEQLDAVLHDQGRDRP